MHNRKFGDPKDNLPAPHSSNPFDHSLEDCDHIAAFSSRCAKNATSIIVTATSWLLNFNKHVHALSPMYLGV